MRLLEMHINGFGIFHDVRIGDLSPGLTVFLGDNESGKSTLLGFLRAVMLGFPDGRSHENPYPPIAGGQHGGAMTLVTEKEEIYVVERRQGPRGGKVEILKPDQTREGAALLHHLLGPAANRTLFKSIYAFGLTELQNIETLNTEAVREALYSAAGGIDPGVLGRMKSALNKAEGSLFKQGGTKPQINTVLARLSAIRNEKRALSNPTEQYDQIRMQVAELQEEIKDLEARKIDKALALRKAERWLQLWPIWVRLSSAREKLSELENIEPFPENGLQRFEELKARHGDLAVELFNKEDNLKRQENMLSLLAPDSSILKQSDSIQQLGKDQGRYEAVVLEIVTLRQELADASYTLQQSVGRLGQSWTEERVVGFDLAITVREEVRSLREKLQQAQRVEDKKREALEGLRSRKRDTELTLNNLPKPAEEDKDQLQRMRETCRKLEALLSRRSFIQNELRHLKGRWDDLREEREHFRAGQGIGPRGFPKWPLALTALIGVGMLGWLFSRQDWAGATGVGALFLVFIVFTIFLARTQKEKQGPHRVKSHLGRLNDRAEGLEKQIQGKETESEDLSGQVESFAAMLPLEEDLSIEAVERVEETLAGHIRTADRWKEAGKDLALLEDRISEGLKELKAAESSRASILRDWQSWLKERGLDPGLSADGALEVLSLIASCRERAEHSNQMREKIASLEQARDDYQELGNRVLAALGRDLVSADRIPFIAHQLLQEFSEAEQSEKKRTLLVEEVALSRASVERLAKQISGLDEEMQSLILSGGGDNEEAFRRRAEVFEARASLLQETGQLEESIRQLSGSLGEMEAVLETLSGMQLENLEKEELELKRDHDETEESLDRAKREEARLGEQIRILMNDEPLFALREEEETLKQRLETLVDEWSTVRLAQGLIRMARTRYEKERQPEIIQRAGRYFRDLTLGKYTSLVAPLGENRIEVLSREQRQKEIGELSRGTAEQLYLSLRFGFIQEFCKNAEALPIVMDEILVNFDTSRARAAVRGILDLSQDHQILFFTCHPWVAKLFLDEEPHTPILEIKDERIKEWANAGPDTEV
ncbi:AAA family ATPase [Thermodesulfobacteriota bacterium]